MYLKSFNTVIQDFTMFLFPNVCIHCGTILHKGENYICINCRSELPFTDYEAYPKNPIEKLFRGRIPLQYASATLFYRKKGVVQKLIQQLKYKDNPSVGEFIAQLTLDKLEHSNRFTVPDAIVEVPLHPKKLKKRGYNQLDLFAKVLAQHYTIPIFHDVLVKTQNTQSQTKKSKWHRLAKLEEKFMLKDSQKIEGKHLLLVDDVITTGATLEACGLELLKAPNIRLSIISMSISSDN